VLESVDQPFDKLRVNGGGLRNGEDVPFVLSVDEARACLGQRSLGINSFLRFRLPLAAGFLFFGSRKYVRT
jgi:hypothetical protein